MKLYITETSPYARLARIVLLEKGLESRVEIIAARTRTAESAYYRINPSGRVPCLIRDDGVGLEGSALICAYLDHLDGNPVFQQPAGEAAWEAQRLEALARSLLDGHAVWGRELQRPRPERSPALLEHEAGRSGRLADLWEREIDHPLMRSALNMAQMTLVCALGLEARNPDLRWRPGHPRLSHWFDQLASRASFAATVPPSGPRLASSPGERRKPTAKLEIEAIGRVHAPRVDLGDDLWGGLESSIVLDERFEADALEGIDHFSHAEVVFAFDRVDPGKVVRGARHPRNDPSWPAVGIFAQRGKNRPNRIGTTLCRILRREGRVLHVAELDAIDGTPVLDIKPVMRAFLPRGEVREPEWSRELMRRYWAHPE